MLYLENGTSLTKITSNAPSRLEPGSSLQLPGQKPPSLMHDTNKMNHFHSVHVLNHPLPGLPQFRRRFLLNVILNLDLSPDGSPHIGKTCSMQI